MTAIIAVMNRGGVALAADRAMTVLGGYGQEKRVFSTVSKLFQVSQSVAVALYQSVDFMGIPMDTVIVTYKEQLGAKSFDTVADWVNDFFAFLQSQIDIFAPFDRSLIEIESFFVNEFLPKTKLIVSDSLSRRSPLVQLTEQQTQATVHQAIERIESEYATAPLCDGLTTSDLDRFTELYTPKLTEFVRTAFLDEPIAQETKTLLVKTAIKVYCTSTERIGTMTGLVFAGFGARELLPSVVGCDLRGALGQTLIYSKGVATTIDATNPAFILPFAQRETADTLTNGIHLDLFSVIESRVKATLQDVYGRFTYDAYKDATSTEQEAITAANGATCERLTQTLIGELRQYTDNRFVSTSLAAVAVLPKNELRDVARGMVEAAITHHLIMPQLATVGGSVDAVVITKGGGVEWANNKGS